MRVFFGLITVLLCIAASTALAQAPCARAPCAASALVEIQFNLYVIPTGQGGDNWPANVWNGPGPVPTQLQETFFVDPASATGSYLTEPGQTGATLLSHVSESFTASDITLTANGRLLEQSATGTFGFAGDRASAYGPAGSFFGGVSLPYGGGGSDFFSQNAQAPPDWAAFLSTSSYTTDTGLFEVTGAFGSLDVLPQGSGAPSSVSVPEPGSLTLWALGGVGLLVMHRQRRRRSRPGHPDPIAF